LIRKLTFHPHAPGSHLPNDFLNLPNARFHDLKVFFIPLYSEPSFHLSLYHMHAPEYIHRLLKGHLEGSLSPEEESIFWDALRSGAYRDLIGEDILSKLKDASLSARTTTLSPETQHRIIERILAEATPVIPISRSKRRFWMVAAAASVIVIIAGMLLYRTTLHPATDQQPLSAIDNHTPRMMPVSLEDGSVIELQPGARLSYPSHFTGAARTVRLEGSAFFKIAPNARQPFYAYSQGIVAHVLGTSFHIIAEKGEGLNITVRTGKIEVSKEATQNAGTILTPNQQLRFAPEIKEPKPMLVDTPLVLTEDPDDHTFTAGEKFRFKAASLASVFRLMEHSYGISIVMENPALGKNLFTGDLGHETLYTALKIVCLSVNADYEVKGTKIFINTH
jgi:transmembrane sensor